MKRGLRKGREEVKVRIEESEGGEQIRIISEDLLQGIKKIRNKELGKERNNLRKG